MLESSQTASTDSPFREHTNSTHKETNSSNGANSQHQLQQHIPESLLKPRLHVCPQPPQPYPTAHVEWCGVVVAVGPGWSQLHLCVSACVRVQHKTHYGNYNDYLFTPGSLHLERETGLGASVWHMHAHSHARTRSRSCCGFVGLMDMILNTYSNKCRNYSVVLMNVNATYQSAFYTCKNLTFNTFYFSGVWLCWLCRRLNVIFNFEIWVDATEELIIGCKPGNLKKGDTLFPVRAKERCVALRMCCFSRLF